MSRFDGLRRLFRLPARAASVERDVDEELAFHLESRIEELVAAGMPRERARATALGEFGDVRDARSELSAIDRRRVGRDARAELWGTIRQDARFALRTMASHRLFSAAALLTFALGIGATAAIFSVVDGVLLRPLPYPNHERLVLVWQGARFGGEYKDQYPFAPANFVDLRERARSFEDVAAFRSWGFTVGDGDEPELVPGARVSPAIFRILGVTPMVGRALLPEDDHHSAARVVLIGYGLWQRRYGGDRSIIGRQITVSGERTTVVGVMPPGFTFPRGAELPSGFQIPPATEMWAPLAFSEQRLRDRGTWDLVVAGLLEPGVSVTQASREVASLLRQLGEEMGASRLELSGMVEDMRDHSVRPVRAGLLLLMSAVALVLLIACANVSNLLVARTMARRRELAIRAALGAGRGRLVRQLITENVLLALAGGALGVGFALVLKRWLLALAPAGLPRLADIAIDGRVVALTLALALLSGTAFGLLAALHAARGGVSDALREGGRGSAARTRARSAFIVVEVAVSLVLLIGAALLTQSFVRLQRVDPGFDPSGVMTAAISLPRSPDRSLAEQGPGWNAVVEPFMERVRTIPGVVAAGGVSSVPLTGAWESTTFNIVGRPVPAMDQRPRAHYAMATAGYFRALRIPLLRGREIEPRDRADALPVVVISRAAAEKYWKNEDPIGRQIVVFDETPLTVVGIVGDVREASLLEEVNPMIYIPFAQFPIPGAGLTVRTTGDPTAIVPALRRELRAVDPTIPLTDARTMESVLDESLAQRRFAMLIVGFFAVSALTLATVGLYGVIAYGVSQRTREIGIRLALGARGADVRRMVLGQGLGVTIVGLVIGLAGSFAASSVLRSQLFEVNPLDPVTYVGIALLLALTAAVASWVPARRATRIDPVEALRQD
ncbi:MAG TPA: ABC transporter permease [Gemmatimonadaceae bacterium]|jgi:putative ABC transport system permease protein|nr:ABC transporter permease [Gemmatimonadaceae bacterium]